MEPARRYERCRRGRAFPSWSVLVGWLGAGLLAAGIARRIDDPGDRPYALAQLAAASTAMLESPW